MMRMIKKKDTYPFQVEILLKAGRQAGKWTSQFQLNPVLLEGQLTLSPLSMLWWFILRFMGHIDFGAFALDECQ